MKKKRFFSVLLSIAIALSFISCSQDSPFESGKAPYGYDSNFDYLSILKSSPGYAYESNTGYPAFTYQDSSDENLNKLKISYNLQNVAGDGEDLSKIFNLLKWVHQKIRHDGSNSDPDPEDALNILRYCQETGKGVNCVMMAIVLNEACLAIGLKSRVIHGNSRDWVFNGEWHAFNIVYSNTLEKWVFVDPTNNAYFTNDNGLLLSVAEIREHLIQDLPLYLNSDADYNGNPVNQSSYLHYLSKNFYRFSCFLYSAFGHNGIFHNFYATNRIFFHLDPQNERQKGLWNDQNYFTSNPDYYWSKP